VDGGYFTVLFVLSGEGPLVYVQGEKGLEELRLEMEIEDAEALSGR